MQTTAPLSSEDQQLLKLLFRKSRFEANSILALGLILIIPSLFPIIIFPAELWWFSALFALLICGGGYAIYYWITKTSRLREQENSLSAGQKYLVSGILQKVQLVDYKFLRYQVGTTITDTYIPLHTSLSSTAIHKRVIKQADALTGQYVTLHLIDLEPGMTLLLQADYNKPFNEIIVPLEEADKQKQYRELRNTWLVAYGIVIVLLSLIYFFIGMKNEALVILGIMLVLLFFILSWFSIPFIREVRNSSQKSIVTTTITEVLTAVVRSGKSSSEYKWYRLGNGTLLQQSKVLLHIGQTVIIESIIKPNGEKGMLMDVKKV